MAAMPAGYSGTPLPRKLGLRDGQAVLFAGLPESLVWLAAARAFATVEQVTRLSDIAVPETGYDVVHAFTASHEDLKNGMETLEAAILPDGMIWISWPKKASKVITDVTEDVVRAEALGRDLVDVKVCAVDDVWSGLKLVIRKDKRRLH